MARTLIMHRFTQGEPGQITDTLLTPEGDPIPRAAVTSVLMTLYDIETGGLDPESPSVGIINTREADDVLVSGEIKIESDGTFILYLNSDDMAILNARRQVERHGLLLVVHYDAGSPVATGKARFEYELWVDNVRG